MKKLKLLLIFMLAVMLAAMHSCADDPELKSGPEWTNPTSDISVADAKRFFEENVTEFNHLTFNSAITEISDQVRGAKTYGRGWRSRNWLPDLRMTPKWGDAVSYRYEKLSVVEIPVSSATTTVNSTHDIGEKRILGKLSVTASRMIVMVYDSETEKNWMFMVTLVPYPHCEKEGYGKPENFRYYGGGNFSGLAFSSTMAGKFVYLYEYQNGYAVQRLNAVSDPFKDPDIEGTWGLHFQHQVAVANSVTRNSSSYFGSGEMDPDCKECNFWGKPCISHDNHVSEGIKVPWTPPLPDPLPPMFPDPEPDPWPWPPTPPTPPSGGGPGNNWPPNGEDEEDKCPYCYCGMSEKACTCCLEYEYEFSMYSPGGDMTRSDSDISLGDPFRVVVTANEVTVHKYNKKKTPKPIQVPIKYEIWAGGAWSFLREGSKSEPFYAVAPGTSKIKAEFEYLNQQTGKNEKVTLESNEFKVGFPTGKQLLNNAVVQQAFTEIWDKSINSASRDHMQEFGAVIFVTTSKHDSAGKYSYKVIDGNKISYPDYLSENRTISWLTFENDNKDVYNPSAPMSGGKFFVMDVHTHPPMIIYDISSNYDRKLGASPGDRAYHAAKGDNVPRYVLDFQTTNANNGFHYANDNIYTMHSQPYSYGGKQRNWNGN